MKNPHIHPNQRINSVELKNAALLRTTNPLYNQQCDPISWSIITWQELVFNLLYLPSGFFFTTFAPVTAIALHCFSCKKKTRGQWVIWLTCEIFSRAKLWVWIRKQLKVHIISPWKGCGPSFEQTWIPFTQGCFVPSLVEIGSVVLEKKIF